MEALDLAAGGGEQSDIPEAKPGGGEPPHGRQAGHGHARAAGAVKRVREMNRRNAQDSESFMRTFRPVTDSPMNDPRPGPDPACRRIAIISGSGS